MSENPPVPVFKFASGPSPLEIKPNADKITWTAVASKQTMSNSLFLQNPSNHYIAFKVKTTAPKQYCVRPNTGLIEKGSSQEVKIILQPLKESSGCEKWKDKFLVQSVVIEGSDQPISKEHFKEIWEQVDKEKKAGGAKDFITDIKLRCEFISPAKVSTVPEEPEPSAPAATTSNTSINSTIATNASFATAVNAPISRTSSSGSSAQAFHSSNSTVSVDNIKPADAITDSEARLVAQDRQRRAELETNRLREQIESLKKQLQEKNEQYEHLAAEFSRAQKLVQSEGGSGLRARGSATSHGGTTPGDDVKTATRETKQSSSMDIKNLLLSIIIAIIFFIVGRVIKD